MVANREKSYIDLVAHKHSLFETSYENKLHAFKNLMHPLVIVI